MHGTLPKTILVVDDERLVRWSLARRLARAGFAVLEAGNGKEALVLAAQGVDLVVLDLRLPDADGLSLLQQIRRANPECAVVMMSAFATPERLQEARDLGALHFALKPFDVERLVDLVEGALH